MAERKLPKVSEEYRNELQRLAQAIASGNESQVEDALGGAFHPWQLNLFAKGNLQKRADKLEKELEFVSEAYEDFSKLVDEFMRMGPLAAYATSSSDGQKLLDWLEHEKKPTPEQQDHIACQRARIEVNDLARANRKSHILFQKRCSENKKWSTELDTDPDLAVQINPMCVRTRFHTKELLDDDTTPPADVLFFPVDKDIVTAMLEPEGLLLVGELSYLGPCTIEEWAKRSDHADRDELVDVCRDLAEMGLVAVFREG